MKSIRSTIVKILQRTGLNKSVHHLYYDHLQGFEGREKEISPLIGAIERSFDRSVAWGTAERGDYYEFGLFKGNSFWRAQKAAADRSLEAMRFFGFDSFHGLPPVKGPDATHHNEFYEGQYACGKDRVIANLNSKGVDWSRTFLIEGYYEQSLKAEIKARYRMNKVAIALIDCDLYSSTMEVLSFLAGMLMDGSILIFDDYNCFDASDDKGQRKAYREFLEANDGYRSTEFFSYGEHGKVFALNAPHPADLKRKNNPS